MRKEKETAKFFVYDPDTRMLEEWIPPTDENVNRNTRRILAECQMAIDISFLRKKGTKIPIWRFGELQARTLFSFFEEIDWEAVDWQGLMVVQGSKIKKGEITPKGEAPQ